MTRSFTYQALPMRVTFGVGALRRLPDEVAALGLTRVLVLCSPEQEATGKLVADAVAQVVGATDSHCQPSAVFDLPCGGRAKDRSAVLPAAG